MNELSIVTPLGESGHDALTGMFLPYDAFDLRGLALRAMRFLLKVSRFVSVMIYTDSDCEDM